MAQCGCDPNEICALDRGRTQVRCSPKSNGTKLDGERCSETSDCVGALECTRDGLCAPYCSVDADCQDLGKCILATDPQSKKTVPGSGACSRWCDPLTGEPCRSGSSCYAAGAGDDDPSATCRWFRDSMTKSRGEPCEYFNECEPGLSCAQFGPSLCTDFCKSDAACMSDAPHCYLDFVKPLVSAPGEPIGQCVPWPCDDANLPSPEPWSEPPVWTLAQLVACRNRCGPSRDCYRSNCANGARWGQCFDQMLMSCAGAIGAACRTEYVALACSDIHGRNSIENLFTYCAEAQPDCLRAAEQACAEQP